MPAGRPPKPTSVLKASGGFRKDRHGDREHTAESGMAIEKPAWLAGDASDFWDRNLPKLEAMGILDGIDESQLAGLATAWANWRKEQTPQESAANRGDSQETKEPSEVTSQVTFISTVSESGKVPPRGVEPLLPD